MTETPIRTFIALKLPENIILFLQSVQQKLMSYGLKVRWVRPENIHLTIKFLGDIYKTDLNDVSATLTESAGIHGPFSFRIKGLGVFPGIRRPRVIWAGIAGETERIAAFQRHLDQSLSNLGYPRESRPFQGHLTLGRFKGESHSGKLVDALNTQSDFESETVTVDRVTLFKSDLKPSGAVYSELGTVSLG
jgi:2'-5' RNA ligase